MNSSGIALLAALALLGASACTSESKTADQDAAAQEATLPQEEQPPAPAPAPEPEVPSMVDEAGLKVVKVEISGALEASLRRALDAPESASALSQVTARMLVWWVDLAKDLRKGDTMTIAYELPKNHEPVLHAVRFTSGKMGKTFKAYRFQPQGTEFAHYFDAEGREIEESLKNSPIDTYDQITSILKDGRKHKGVDFRAPSGTPVKMPFDATLSRKNWKFKGNGNCLDFVDGKGRHIIFLHLEEIPSDLKIGHRYRQGEVVAKSGNSGRSFAPHLHYQLEDAKGKVLDPFKVHETYRKTVPAASMGTFEATMRRYDEMMGAVAE